MKWVAILFTLFIILVIVLADTGRLGILGNVYRIPYADKAAHFILYGILALLICLTLFGTLPNHSRKWIAVISGLILALFIGLEEVSQQYIANRSFSLIDLSASYLGVIFFSCIAIQITRRK